MGQQRMGQSSIPGGIFGAPSQQLQRSGGFGTSQSDPFLARLERVETDTRPTGAGGSEPITLQNWERKSKQIAALAASNEARNEAAMSRASGESAQAHMAQQQLMAQQHERNTRGQGEMVDRQMQMQMQQQPRQQQQQQPRQQQQQMMQQQMQRGPRSNSPRAAGGSRNGTAGQHDRFFNGRPGSGAPVAGGPQHLRSNFGACWPSPLACCALCCLSRGCLPLASPVASPQCSVTFS